MHSTKQLLIAARALIDTPDKWTQKASARTRAGLPIDPKSKKAVCFCMEGALIRAAHSDEEVFASLEELRKFQVQRIFQFNDSHTHQEVLNAFDRAIENADANTDT